MAGLLILAAAAGFACTNPSHHDGDAIRCAGGGKSMRLYGIDAPEMPGACRPGRACTPGDPYAARDYLAALTRGRQVRCEQRDIDDYGRRVVRCTAGGRDLGCAMVAAGHAVERYGRLGCGRAQALRIAATTDTAPPAVAASAAPAAAAPRVPQVALGLWLLVINILAYAGFAIDKQRVVAGPNGRGRRVPEGVLLAAAALGGSIGAVIAQQLLRHKTRKQPFATNLLLIAGVQIGIVVGLLALRWLPAA